MLMSSLFFVLSGWYKKPSMAHRHVTVSKVQGNMNSFIVFSSFLIATFAIQCSECSAVQVIDSFFPLNSQSTNSRGTSQRSRSTRSNSGLKNSNKKTGTVGKMETIGFVEQQANQLNPSSYMNVGEVQQPTTLQDGLIKQGNDALAYYSINYNDGNNQRQRYPSRYRSRSSQLQRSNSLNFPETAKL